MQSAEDDSWTLLPEQVQQQCLLGLTYGPQGSKLQAAPGGIARRVCSLWRRLLDGSATHVALHDWPAPGARPVHLLFPHAQAVSLLALPPDISGGRVEQLLSSLQQLSSFTRLELSWNTAVAAAPPVITQRAAECSHAATSSAAAAASAAAVGPSGPQAGADADHGPVQAANAAPLASGVPEAPTAAAAAPPTGAAVVVGPSTSGMVSVTQPYLPSSLSRLQQLAALSICSPVKERLNTVAADAVRGWEVPAEMCALTGLTSLTLECVVPPRRHLSRLVHLQHLELAGWLTIMKSAVHLHRLPALSHLSLRVAEPDMDPAQSLAEQLHVMIGKQLAAAVWGELTRRAALMQQQKEQQQQQQEQQEQEAWHEDGSGCAGSSTTAGVPVAGPKDSPNNPPMQQLTKLTLVWPALPPTQSEVFYKNTGWNAAAEALGGALTCLEMEGPVCASAQLSEGLEHLTGLAELALCSHRLPVLCLPWGKLKGLTRLTAEHNNTTSTDAGISCLTGLRELSVKSNCLRALPSELAGCSRLVKLWVAGNQLSTLPQELTALRLLEDLDVSHCSLVDSCFALDGPLTALTALTRLQLHSNRLRAAPKAALALPNLRQISLGNNYYDQGQAEAALVLGVLPGLKQLDWAGPAPGAAALPAVQRWVGSCRWLRTLRLMGQDIQELQPELFQLGGLEELDVSGNKLSSLPEALGRLTALTRLQLAHNQLPALPASITCLGCLVHLDCCHNCLAQLPGGMSRLQQLDTVNLFYNSIHTLPSEWWWLPSLRVCDVGVCYALKALPSSWGQPGALPKLQLLRVSQLLRDDPVLLLLRQRGVEVKVARGLEHKLFAGDEGDVLPGRALAGMAAAAAGEGGGGGDGAGAAGADGGGGVEGLGGVGEDAAP